MYKSIYLWIGVVAVLLFGGYVLLVSRTSTTALPQSSTTQTTPTPTAKPAEVVATTSQSATPAPQLKTNTKTTTTQKPVPTEVAHTSITIKDYSFVPSSLSIKKGTTITWTNKDIAKHTVTGEAGGPSSEFFGQNQTYSYTFNTPGIYPYHCEPHPYMTATIVVTE